MRSTKLSTTTKLSAEYETPPVANVLLAAALSFVWWYGALDLIIILRKCHKGFIDIPT